VTTGNQDARDAAVARFATGYAVAYRSLPADPSAKALLKLAFFDSVGNLGGVRSVVEVARNAGTIRMALARDGRLFIAWVDAPSGQPMTLRAVRAVCQ
jgi:hypothetical protein